MSDAALVSRRSGRSWSLETLASVAAFAMVLGGCGASGSGSNDEASVADAGHGAEVFGSSCASCHGSDLRGTDRGPALLSIVYEPGHHPDAAFRSAIVNGAPQHHWSFGNMPPVRGLSDADIDAVITHVRAQQDDKGFESYPPRP